MPPEQLMLYQALITTCHLRVFILWMGWFGFNGGSTSKLGGIAVANEVANVFLNTNAAASGGLIAALIVARMILESRSYYGIKWCPSRISRQLQNLQIHLRFLPQLSVRSAVS